MRDYFSEYLKIQQLKLRYALVQVLVAEYRYTATRTAKVLA